MLSTDRTPKQINEALALLYGWQRYGTRGYLDPLGNWHEHPPNFCGDWAYVGPLWSELVNVYGFDDAAFTVSEQWSALRRMEHPKPIEDKKTIDTVIKEAIARATLAWKEGEG